MAERLTRIYTRTGDDGSTGLGDGRRLAKDDPRIEALGCVDELNSLLGMTAAQGTGKPREQLQRVQHRLFELGAELAQPGVRRIRASDVAWLERCLDEWNSELPALREFILPGGGLPAASCHFARAVCRRAERRLVRLARTEPVNAATLSYLNRLSDLLFVLARILTRQTGGTETSWQPEQPES